MRTFILKDATYFLIYRFFKKYFLIQRDDTWLFKNFIIALHNEAEKRVAMHIVMTFA